MIICIFDASGLLENKYEKKEYINTKMCYNKIYVKFAIYDYLYVCICIDI